MDIPKVYTVIYVDIKDKDHEETFTASDDKEATKVAMQIVKKNKGKGLKSVKLQENR